MVQVYNGKRRPCGTSVPVPLASTTRRTDVSKGSSPSWGLSPSLLSTEVQFMRRMKAKRRLDGRIFSRTADRTKAVNVTPILTRGGFRL